MRKKNVDYEKIAALEFKLEELKNKIILKYINSLSQNEMKAIEEISILSEKVRKDKNILKKDKKQRKELERSFSLFSGLLVFCSGLFTFIFSPIISILVMVATYFMAKYIKKDSLKKVDELIVERKKNIKSNEDKIETNKRIIQETKKRINVLTSESNVKIFEQLESELLKSNMKLDNIYLKLEQIITNFNENIEANKKVETRNLEPVDVAAIDVLYKTSYDRAKKKSLELNK